MRKRGRTADATARQVGVDPDAEGNARMQRQLDRLMKSAELNGDDAATWAQFASALTPTKATPTKAPPPKSQPRSRREAQPLPNASTSMPVLKPATLDVLVRNGIGAANAGFGTAPRGSVPVSLPTSHPQPKLPRDRGRKIARGQTTIDGRLDLHGLTLDGAHRALSSFLRQVQAAGWRTVLVITGKGLDEAALKSRPFDADLDVAPRGVLKRAVPEWLRSDAFQMLVAGFGDAHARHGGTGALYVEIRRKR